MINQRSSVPRTLPAGPWSDKYRRPTGSNPRLYAVRVPLVRQALESDVDRIHSLIVELATYERSADQVKATPINCVPRSSGPSRRRTHWWPRSGDEVVGFALYFRNFSTWEGVHGIYLEDLYVKPEHRGAGHGKALLRSLAALAVERGYARLEWAVLNWNQPSIDFYRSLGAVPLDEWIVYRLSGDPLLQVAQLAVDSPA